MFMFIFKSNTKSYNVREFLNKKSLTHLNIVCMSPKHTVTDMKFEKLFMNKSVRCE